jgi:hypothetical protein
LWDVWIIRNADLHGRDNAEQEQKRKEKLRPHVIALYATVDSLLACDKPIFDTPIRDRSVCTRGYLSFCQCSDRVDKIIIGVYLSFYQ